MAKTVWISGASRGIGKSAAVHFARAGYKIAAGYHENDAAMQSLMQQLAEIGAMAVPVKGDIATLPLWKAWLNIYVQRSVA